MQSILSHHWKLANYNTLKKIENPTPPVLTFHDMIPKHYFDKEHTQKKAPQKNGDWFILLVDGHYISSPHKLLKALE
jgi:hypothetical protein